MITKISLFPCKIIKEEDFYFHFKDKKEIHGFEDLRIKVVHFGNRGAYMYIV